MRAFVEKEECIGCGLCTGIAEGVFELDEDGKAEAVADTTDDNRSAVAEAIDSCPTSAIREHE